MAQPTPRSARTSRARAVRLGRRRRVVARAGVVEERVVGAARRSRSRTSSRAPAQRGAARPRRVALTRVVEPAVDRRAPRALEPEKVAAVRERAVERRGRGEARLAGGEQPPDHAAAEAEADRGDLLAAAARRASSLTAACMSASKRSGVRLRRAPPSTSRLAGERRRPALLGEQVDRERGEAARPRSGRRRADVVGEARGSRGSRARRRDRPARGAPTRPAASRCGPGNVIGSRRDRRPRVSTPAGPACARPRRAVAAACRAVGARARPRPASRPAAAVAPRPSRPRRRIASRRVMMPSAWSSATSSARYRWSSVIVPPATWVGSGVRRRCCQPADNHASVPHRGREPLGEVGEAARVAVVDAAVRRVEELARDVRDADLGERVAEGERPELEVPLVARAAVEVDRAQAAQRVGVARAPCAPGPRPASAPRRRRRAGPCAGRTAGAPCRPRRPRTRPRRRRS